MAIEEHEIAISITPGIAVGGTLALGEQPRGIVVFAHGSGSSRYSPRNRQVAGFLQRQGLATLLMDLLTPEEEEAERFTRHLRFDIELLAGRLVQAKEWLAQDARTRALPVGYFGASTGAAAALVAAARAPEGVSAVVSRGGRPDLTGDQLPRVRAPTLLIVGGNDLPVIEMNRDALRLLRCEKRLEIVPGATHLFEERGTLEVVAHLAAGWFAGHLAARQPAWTEETGQWS
jgi:putative phosphoribosyl transferase